MSVFKSSTFASIAASSKDWREISKTILLQLEETSKGEKPYTLGFLYVSDMLAEDVESILNLFRSVLPTKHWVGCVGVGVCGTNTQFMAEPAISVMLCQFKTDDFCPFPAVEMDREPSASVLKKWLLNHSPMLGVIHADPTAEEHPEDVLPTLADISKSFLVGGVSSSRTNHFQFMDDLSCNGPSGVIFSDSIEVATMVSHGCKPIGKSYTVTRVHDNVIQELDGEEPSTAFEQALHSMVVKKIDRDPSVIFVDEEALHDPDALPEEFQSLLKGEVHAAVLLSDSDQEDFLVRRINGMNNDDGSLTLSRPVNVGDRLMFIHRNQDTVKEGLSHDLVALRKRIEKEHGYFEPKGALYFSSISRTLSDEGDVLKGEIELIRDVLGNIPLTGFYANGEISNARLYSHSGILTLFL